MGRSDRGARQKIISARAAPDRGETPAARMAPRETDRRGTADMIDAALPARHDAGAETQ
jgi:hypothetical protein